MVVKVEDVYNLILRHFNFNPGKDSVDQLITGDLSAEVKGIAVTFMATVNVIREAIKAGANLIITHEPTYYDGRDDKSQVIDSDIYKAKQAYLESNHISVIRIHDAVHRADPDLITYGTAEKLGWNPLRDAHDKYIFTIPETPLTDLIDKLKKDLDIEQVRYIGKPDTRCSKIYLSCGSVGGRRQIEYLDRKNIDVIICGESTEWEATEYTRDASDLGVNKAMIILGHERSEEPGMEQMARLLKELMPDMPISFIPAGSPFTFR